MFALIEFLNENAGTCEVVPLNWLSGDQKTCRWPPASQSAKRAISLKLEPQRNWKKLDVKLVFFNGNLLHLSYGNFHYNLQLILFINRFP